MPPKKGAHYAPRRTTQAMLEAARRRPKRMPVEATRAHIASMQAERERREAEAREKTRQTLNLKALHESDERTQFYRAEKAAGLKRHEAKMAEAKAAWNRMLDDLRESGKGGRPRKTISIKRDPANALVEALERGA